MGLAVQGFILARRGITDCVPRRRPANIPMRSWRKHASVAKQPSQGVSRAAAGGASRAELVKVAVTFLLANTEADRMGVWVESQDRQAGEIGQIAGLRGVVADRDGSATPSEWERLSLEAPLPTESLAAGKSVEQDFDATPDAAILGILVGMQRACWIPVESKGRLRGVLLAGLRKNNGAAPCERLELVAAELSLALEVEEERHLARERLDDMVAARRWLSALANFGATDAILNELVQSCTAAPRNEGGIGAGFAILAAWEHKTSGGSFPQEFRPAQVQPSWARATLAESGPVTWQSGEVAWPRAMEREGMEAIWRRARERNGAIWTPSALSGPYSEMRGEPGSETTRIAAIAVDSGNKSLGVLAVGFPRVAISSAILGRLELRAALAGVALRLRQCAHEAAANASQLQAVLEVSSSATVLVHADGSVAATTRGAKALCQQCRDHGDAPPTENSSQMPVFFAEMFRARDQRAAGDWLQCARGLQPVNGAEDEAPEFELHNGARVRLRRVIPPGAAIAGVSLEPVIAQDTSHTEQGEARLVNVIEWLEEGVVVFDADHSIRAMNTRFAQIAGLTSEEATRITTLNGLIARLSAYSAHPEHFAEHWREQTRSNDAGVREEIRLLRPVPRILERAARPITDAAGRRIGLVEVYRDLTAQRVFQSKLLHTEKLAALGQMVTSVAHELSNPLTSILGYAQRLFVAGDCSRPEEVQQIFQEAERATTIVRQLLMTARDSRPERRRTDLNQIVSRTLELQRIGIAAENIGVEQDLDIALPMILGDAGQLQQVLMNLIGNSRQAIDQRGQGGTIRLSTMRVGERRARLEVSDDGPGIPDAILSRIFDPFFTTKPAGVGTGLGLSIVLGIVREHGGQVHVSSPPRGGVTFTLDFPVVSGDESRFPAVPATGLASRVGAVERKGTSAAVAVVPNLTLSLPRKILVVEDEPTVGRLIGDVLEDEGLQVDVLLDGREALRRAEREAYDLVICDMKMPELDGQHFYQALVSSGNPLRKRFLFVTGDVVSAHTHEFLERHQLPHVAKPFRVEELTEKVNRLLAGTSPEPLRGGGKNQRSEEMK
jgi:PAS domain S-box-containing protein